MGVTAEGVDKHFYEKAVTDKKSLEFFETAEQQIDMITNMGKGNEDAMIMHTLRDLEKMEVQRKLLAFYELMTSMTVKDEGDGKMVCTLKNRVKRNATRFIIGDIEGAEVELLKGFDFKTHINVISIEHNYNIKNREEIYKILKQNNFKRLGENFSMYDDYYVNNNIK